MSNDEPARGVLSTNRMGLDSLCTGGILARPSSTNFRVGKTSQKRPIDDVDSIVGCGCDNAPPLLIDRSSSVGNCRDDAPLVLVTLSSRISHICCKRGVISGSVGGKNARVSATGA